MSARRALRWARWIGPLLTVALLGAGSGCFGDWVRAKKYPNREELPPVKPAPQEDRGPERPCVAYRAQIAEICGGLLEGKLERSHCYTEVLKLSAKPAIDDEFADPKDGLTQRQRSCRGDYLALARAREDDEPRDAAELGPDCKAWAAELKTRCVVPLADVDALLPTECGSWLMTMQTLVRGRPERREQGCVRGLARLRAEGESDGGSGGAGSGDAGSDGGSSDGRGSGSGSGRAD